MTGQDPWGGSDGLSSSPNPGGGADGPRIGPGAPRSQAGKSGVPSPGLDLTPAPGAARTGARWWAQARLEWRQLMTNGEQLLLTLVIPVAVLVAVTWAGLASIDEATPGVMALAILSTAFTATAIATGFERRSGVLKFLGSTPLGRTGLLVGKTAATLAVIVVQLVLLAAIALSMGWAPPGGAIPAVVVVVLLGTLAFGAWGVALAGLLRAEATLAVANGIFLLLLFAGGTVLPADRLPGPLASMVGFLPSAALGDALRALLDPANVASGLPITQMLVLLAWAVAGTALAVRTFRWE